MKCCNDSHVHECSIEVYKCQRFSVVVKNIFAGHVQTLQSP